MEEVLGRMAEVISDTSHLDARSELIEFLNSAQAVLPDCVMKSDRRGNVYSSGRPGKWTTANTRTVPSSDGAQ